MTANYVIWEIGNMDSRKWNSLKSNQMLLIILEYDGTVTKRIYIRRCFHVNMDVTVE